MFASIPATDIEQSYSWLFLFLSFLSHIFGLTLETAKAHMHHTGFISFSFTSILCSLSSRSKGFGRREGRVESGNVEESYGRTTSQRAGVLMEGLLD